MGDISTEIQSSFQNNDVKAYINILYTANWISNKQLVFFKPYGISAQQYNILRIVRGANKPISVQSVKGRMFQRSPNVTRLMDKLCSKKLINRVISKEDRRVVNVSITNEGLKLLEAIDDKLEVRLLDNLTENEAKQLSDLLDKIR